MTGDPAAVIQLAYTPNLADRRSAAPAPTEEDGSDALRRRMRRLALDVHDGPMQSLIAVGVGLGQLRQRLAAASLSGEDAVAELEPMVSELANAEQGMRDLITTLESAGKTDLDSLESIARAELERFKRLCPAVAELDVVSGAWPDSHSQEIAIRAVLRESLNNVAQHAQARRVCVRLHADDAVIRLEVADDGDGFDPGVVEADRIGLVSMRERLHLLGGRLAIDSKPGGPTRISAIFHRWRPTE
jgi:two-component system, NarL family, sensor histidine kinase DegS